MFRLNYKEDRKIYILLLSYYNMRIGRPTIWPEYEKIQQAQPTEIIQNLDGTLYAILFNANECRHSYDMQETYYALLHAGISDSDIAVLEGDGKTQNRFVDAPATAKNLESEIDKIRKKADSNDRLLVYVTNHGKLINGQCNFDTYDGVVWENDFEKMAQDIPVNFGVFYFAQCHSGGFAERMGYGKNIGMSSTNREKTSQGRQNGIGAYFTYRLFDSIMVPDMTIENAFDSTIDTGIDTSERTFWKYNFKTGMFLQSSASKNI